MTQTSDKKYAAGIRWDLTDLYASAEDPKLEADLQLTEKLALDFEKTHKPRLEAFASAGTPFDLAALLRDFKVLIAPETRVGVFAHLSFAEKTDDAKRGAFMQKIQDRLTEINNHLLFWGILWCKAPEPAVRALISRPEFAADRHYLEDMRKYAPHTLTEPEEKILSIKDNTGGSAFSRLFDETVNRIPFYIEEGGKRVQKTETEVLALLHSADRAVRKAGSESLAEGLKANSHVLTYIYNMILADHRSSMKLRGYMHPAQGRNLANETNLPTLENLIKCVRAAYPIAQRYYKLKSRLLGLEPMYDYDRYASLSETESAVPYAECKRIVLEGYRDFSPEAAAIIQQFFDKNWIDAEIRTGKQGGGFCCQTTPDLHPYILVNYTGHLRDVLTVAHELGHGLHQYLARKVGILESDAPLTMAETASVFGEMLIFDRILGEAKNPKERLALLCGKIDDNFATVFRQIAMTDFELRAHLEGIKEGELSEEKLNELWMQTNSELYGSSVQLTENYRHGWKYIPHFVHTPFYCYAYSFAQLFVLALYQKYKETGASFVPKYLEMLSLGGSKKPEELAAGMGLDLQDPNFWNLGLKLLDTLVSEAETLSAKSS
jgi:oligoendopeptidase F